MSVEINRHPEGPYVKVGSTGFWDIRSNVLRFIDEDPTLETCLAVKDNYVEAIEDALLELARQHDQASDPGACAMTDFSELVGKKVLAVHDPSKKSDALAFIVDGGRYVLNGDGAFVLAGSNGDPADIIGGAVKLAEAHTHVEDVGDGLFDEWVSHDIRTEAGRLWLRWMRVSSEFHAVGVRFEFVPEGRPR